MPEPVRIALPPSLRILRRVEWPRKLGMLDRIYSRRLSEYGVAWVQTAVGPVWKLDLRNPTHRWIVYGYYESRGFFRWAKSFLSRNDVVVDSGANIGQVVLYFSSWLSEGRILAFEPGAEASAWLAECLEQNRMVNVEMIRMGLSDSAQDATLQDSGPASTHGSWSRVVPNGTGGQQIRMDLLDRFLDERRISEVAIWKLDVEGSELSALKGAAERLRRKKIRALWVELVGDRGDQVKRFMGALGYDCFLIRWSGALVTAAPDRTLAHTNGLFLPRNA